MKWSDSLAPLREHNFRWYFASRFVNTLGTMMATIALTFAVLDLDGSTASDLGLVLAAHTAPMVLLVLWGGVLSDRFSRIRVLQLSNITSALSQGAIAVLVLTDRAELWMVVVLSAVHGSVSAMALPAMSSMVVQLVSRRQLQGANTLLSLTRNSLTVLGPTVGALIVVAASPGWALAVDGAAWLVAAVLLLPVRLPARERTASTSTFTELREGWDFFRRTTWLWVVVVGFAVLNAVHSGAIFILGPVVAEDTVGRQGWGYVLSAQALGLVLMGVVLLRVRLERPLLWGMACITGVGLPMLVLGTSPTLLALVIAAVVAGAGLEVFGLGWNLAMQENIDEQMLSRAFSYDMLGSIVAVPLGQIAYGPLGEWFGASRVLVISGIVYIAVCALVLCSREVRSLPRNDRVEIAR